MYKIYMHTSPDGRVYIGQTSQNLKKRWKCGFGYKHNDYFFANIIKYGWDNFKHEILFDGLTKEEACAKESELISLYKSNDADYGFNVSDGGAGRTGSGKKVYCVETNKLYKTAKQAEKETGINRTHIGGCCRKERLTAGGFHWCFEPDIESESVRKRKTNTYKKGKIQCIETGSIYENCIEAQRETGVNASNINRACNGTRKSAGNFHWKYYKER